MACLPKRLTSSNFKQFIDSFDTVLTDCDGVIWVGNAVIGEANVAINLLQDLGKKVFYVTNNSTRSRDEYIAKCDTLGFKASKDNIVSSAYVLAEYLKQQNFRKKVYILGSSGICKELEQVGISYEYIEEEPCKNIVQLVDEMKLDPEVGAVAVGFDAHFNFPKIMRAGSYLNKPDCLFIGTNTDEQFPIPESDLVCPGTGCLVRCVETVSERRALIMGKPSELMFSVISKKHSLDPSRTLMIGDRCNTDILFGKNCGMKTLVVLSGVTRQSDLETWAASSDPTQHRLLADYCLDEISELIPLLNSLGSQ